MTYPEAFTKKKPYPHISQIILTVSESSIKENRSQTIISGPLLDVFYDKKIIFLLFQGDDMLLTPDLQTDRTQTTLLVPDLVNTSDAHNKSVHKPKYRNYRSRAILLRKMEAVTSATEGCIAAEEGTCGGKWRQRSPSSFTVSFFN